MKQTAKLLSDTKALVMGLGLHGGGVATAVWLFAEGAVVRATDKRTAEVLQPSLAALKKFSIAYTLGAHKKEDFLAADIVVVNPGVPRESEYIALAKKAGKRIENDTSLFFQYDPHVKIAITGTRGKTTTTLFVADLLKKKYPLTLPSGNTPKNALLKEYTRIKGKDVPVVAELSSWQLEYLPTAKKAPHIALITNLFPDHLNRYRGMNDYANAKAGIFRHQQEGDYLILNKENIWTAYFLKKKPKGLVFFVSKKPLTKTENGIYLKGDMLIFQADETIQKLFSIKRFALERGIHNLENMMGAVLAVKLFDPTISITESDVLRLATPIMRQEVVYKKGNTQIVNDSCATSPDGTIVAVERFAKEGTLLVIVGGTDKSLEYAALARYLRKKMKKEHVILLAGSATKKLQAGFGPFQPDVHENLIECVREAALRMQKIKGKKTLLFSPGAASFEKFLHEFDRGEKFNALVKKYFK